MHSRALGTQFEPGGTDVVTVCGADVFACKLCDPEVAYMLKRVGLFGIPTGVSMRPRIL